MERIGFETRTKVCCIDIYGLWVKYLLVFVLGFHSLGLDEQRMYVCMK